MVAAGDKPGQVPLPADIQVRALTPTDGHAVTVLIACCDFTYRDFAPPGWEPPEDNHAHHLYEKLWSRGALDADDRLIGLVAWEQFREPGGGALPGVAHVSAVFVDPARWRQGIAAALLDQAEEAMCERAYYLARLWTPEGGPARRFYEAHGWRRDGRSKWQDRLELDIVGYEKPLIAQRKTGRSEVRR